MPRLQRRRRDQTAFNPTLASTDGVATALAALSTVPNEADIACRAYELYEQRGGEHGHAWDDWFQAERELRGRLRED